MTDDEKFFAWLDGELSPDEAAAMDARVAADPALARLAEQHRALGVQLRGAFDPVASAAAPDRVGDALGRRGQVIDFAAAGRARSTPSLPQWASIAATLAIGVLVGTMIPHSGSARIEAHGGKLYAAAALDKALDTQLASAPAGDARIGLTFHDQSGAICRSFTDRQSSGLACRDGDRWQVRGLFAATEGQAANYRMAAGMDTSLAALVDSTIAGEPFDAVAERNARERGWR